MTFYYLVAIKELYIMKYPVCIIGIFTSFLDPERQAKGSYTITFFVSCVLVSVWVTQNLSYVIQTYRVSNNY